jgi:glutamate-1-semialdehyde aminotransferase
MDGIGDIFLEAGIPFCLNGYPAMFSFAIGVEKVNDQRSWNESEKDYYLALIEGMIARGVMPDHDAREPWFLCYSHSEADIDTTLDVVRETVKSVERRT